MQLKWTLGEEGRWRLHFGLRGSDSVLKCSESLTIVCEYSHIDGPLRAIIV